MGSFTRRAATVWVSALTLLLAWSGVGLVVGAGEQSRYGDKKAAYAKSLHFWSVVGSKTDNVRPGVLDKLATDMRDRTPDQIRAFRGDSNRYGGITGELGYDPFNGENCSECGPLDDDFVDRVIEAKNGRVTDAAGPGPVDPGGPALPPWPIWLVWIVSLPAALFYGKRKAEKKYAGMPHEARLIRELGDTMKGLSEGSPEYHELSALRERLEQAMTVRVRYGEDEKNTLRMEQLKDEAKTSLEAITEGNRAHR